MAAEEKNNENMQGQTSPLNHAAHRWLHIWIICSIRWQPTDTKNCTYWEIAFFESCSCDKVPEWGLPSFDLHPCSAIRCIHCWWLSSSSTGDNRKVDSGVFSTSILSPTSSLLSFAGTCMLLRCLRESFRREVYQFSNERMFHWILIATVYLLLYLTSKHV